MVQSWVKPGERAAGSATKASLRAVPLCWLGASVHAHTHSPQSLMLAVLQSIWTVICPAAVPVLTETLYCSMEFGCEVVQLILTGFIVMRT